MKKLALFLAVIMLTIFTGCDQSTDNATNEPYSLVIILGSHSNARNLDFGLIEDELMDAVNHSATVYIIVNDGSASIDCKIDIPAISRILSATNQQRKATGYRNQLVEHCESVSADSDEADVYASLSLASRCINSKKDRVIMFDCGISTSGRVDFTTTTLNRVDVNTMVERVLEDSYLDFHGASVDVYGLGEVAGAQPKLSIADYHSLIDFYQKLLSRANCEVTINTTPFSTVGEVSNNFHVSVCPVSSNVIKVVEKPAMPEEENSEPAPEVTPILDGVVLDIPMTSVSFLPDSSELMNPTDAIKAMTDISASLKMSQAEMVIVGMCATAGQYEDAVILSEKRAKTIQLLLAENGVNTSDYIIVGTGYSKTNPFHVNDTVNGVLNESLAALNRTVLIMTKETADTVGLI